MKYSYNKLTDDEYLELSNLTDDETGIDDVVIWVGPDSEYNMKRIKVSNVKNSYLGDNCFILTFPDFKIKGIVNKKLITDKVLNKIKQFVNLNIDIINSYSNYEIPTDVFLDGIKPIK